MKKRLYLTILAAALTVLHVAAARYDYVLRVQRSAMAVVNGNVVVSMQLTALQDVPAGQSVILMPVLEDSVTGRRHEFPMIFLNSRNQQIFYQRQREGEYPDAMMLRKPKGEPVEIEYLRSVRYEPWMQQATLKLQKLSCACRDMKERGEQTLATLAPKATGAVDVKIGLHPAYLVPPADQGEKVRQERGEAYLTFVVDKTDIRPNYMRNAQELRKIDESVNLVRQDADVTITHMQIEGWASPEGSAPHNQELSDGRTEALRRYLSQTGQTRGIRIDARGRGENWPGLLDALRRDTHIPQRGTLTDIAENQRLSPDEREQRMRREAPAGYRYVLHNIYPRLRRTNYSVFYTVRPFTLEESERVFARRPGNLSLGEIYRLADKYRADEARFTDIMTRAAGVYPDDSYINLTMAYLAIKRGDAGDAARRLERVKAGPQKTLNEGLVAYLQGDYERALRLVDQAAATGLKEAVEQQREFRQIRGK